MTLGALIVLLVGLVMAVSLWLGTRPGTPEILAPALRVAAAVVTLGVGAGMAPAAWRDSGAFALALVGVPAVAALAVLGLTVARRPATAVTWAAAAVILAWGLLTALGLGVAFLGPALLMTLAAGASTHPRHTPPVAPLHP